MNSLIPITDPRKFWSTDRTRPKRNFDTILIKVEYENNCWCKRTFGYTSIDLYVRPTTSITL